jgi:hypothetical protein
VRKQDQRAPHLLCKVSDHCGSVLVCLITALRGTGIVSAPVLKKMLMMASMDDCYTSVWGCTATFDAISKTRPSSSGNRSCSPSLPITNSLSISLPTLEYRRPGTSCDYNLRFLYKRNKMNSKPV